MSNLILIIVCSFILGSIPNGLIIGKVLKGIDLRQYGSKNIGATNAFRVLGLWPALLVLLTDMLKGVLGVYIGHVIAATPTAELLGGIAAMAGHNWSIFLRFKGGRGVATGLGVIAILVPKVTLLVFCVWAIIVAITKYVSLGSIVAAILVPVSMWLFGVNTEILYFGILAAIFIVIRHRPNIERLLNGTESKIKANSVSVDFKKENK